MSTKLTSKFCFAELIEGFTIKNIIFRIKIVIIAVTIFWGKNVFPSSYFKASWFSCNAHVKVYMLKILLYTLKACLLKPFLIFHLL